MTLQGLFFLADPLQRMAEELALIAQIIKPHGIRGEVSLRTFTFDEERFLTLKRVTVRSRDGSLAERTVDSVRLTGQGVLITFEGITDRTAAEALRNMELLVPLSERPALPEGRAYYDEVIGMRVVDDDTGEELGTVADVIDMPAGDVFVLTLEGGREHLVTGAGDEVRRIDTKKKELRVKLLEEY